MTGHKTKTSADLWDFVTNVAETDGKFFELIDGEIVQTMPSTPYCSEIAALILHYVLGYVLENDLGHVTGEAGGYYITEEDTFAPDVAFISAARQPDFPQKGFNPIPPDLAVEVVSPSDLDDPTRRIQRKLEKYKAARIPLLWYVYADPRKIDVYVTGELVATLGEDDVLDGGDVLPGFRLSVAKIFPTKRAP